MNVHLHLPYDTFKDGPFNKSYFPDGRFFGTNINLVQRACYKFGTVLRFHEDDEKGSSLVSGPKGFAVPLGTRYSRQVAV